MPYNEKESSFVKLFVASVESLASVGEESGISRARFMTYLLCEASRIGCSLGIPHEVEAGLVNMHTALCIAHSAHAATCRRPACQETARADAEAGERREAVKEKARN